MAVAKRNEFNLNKAVEEAVTDPKKLQPGLLLQLKSAFPFTRMDEAQAFLALLDIAISIDREVHADESTELGALTERSRFLAKLQMSNRKKFLEIRRKVDAHKGADVPTKDVWNFVMEACLALPGKMKISAFSHVVDLLFADRKFVESEFQYITLIARLLKIPRKDSERVLDVLRLKNEVRAGADRHSDRPPPGPRGSKEIEEGDVVSNMALRQLYALSPETAHFAILKCAVWADKIKNQPEQNELGALWRTPSLAACSTKLRQAIADYVKQAASELGYEKLYDKAIEYLDKDLYQSVFAQAADLVMVDSYIAPEEVKFLEKLRKSLSIGTTDADQIIRVLKAKNEY